MTRVVAAVLAAVTAAGCASSSPIPTSATAPAAMREDGEYGEYGQPVHRSWEDRTRLYTTIVPYAWSTSTSGDTVLKSVPVRYDEGPDQAAFGLRAEMYSERVGFFVDGFYATVSHKDAGVEYDDRVGVIDVGVAMRILGGEPWQGFGERPNLDFDLDGLALVRNHFLNMEATPTGSFSNVSQDEYWADFALGMRGTAVILGRVSVIGRIDVGGLATNQWHSWSWNGELGAKLRLTKNLGVQASYRWFVSHWEDDTPAPVVTPLGTPTIDSSRDIRIQGPWVGIVLEF